MGDDVKIQWVVDVVVWCEVFVLFYKIESILVQYIMLLLFLSEIVVEVFIKLDFVYGLWFRFMFFFFVVLILVYFVICYWIKRMLLIYQVNYIFGLIVNFFSLFCFLVFFFIDYDYQFG